MARTKCTRSWKVSRQIAHSRSQKGESEAAAPGVNDSFERSPGGAIGAVPTQLFDGSLFAAFQFPCDAAGSDNRLSKQTLGMNPQCVSTLPKMKGMFGSLTWRQSQTKDPACTISQGSGNASRPLCDNNEGEKSEVTSSIRMVWVHPIVDAHDSSQNFGVCSSSGSSFCGK